MKNKLPGKRTLKTALSVAFCLIIAYFMERLTGLKELGFYSSIGAIFVLSSNLKETKKRGIERIYGTLVGGGLGVVMYYIDDFVVQHLPYIQVKILVIVLGLILTIHICYLLDITVGLNIACIVYMGILLLKYSHNVPFEINVLVRIFETIIGTIIAYYVNKYIFPYNENA